MSFQVQVLGEQEAVDAIEVEGELSKAEIKGMAAAAANLTKQWFRDRNASHPHTYPMGGRRSNYWSDAAKATTWAVEDQDFSVLVAKLGVNIHYHGGDIVPSGRTSSVTGKPITTLAIPAADVAYGRLPSDFPNLHITIYKAHDKAALSLPTSGLPLFWLVKSVHLQGDTSVIPSSDLYMHVVLARLAAMRDRQLETTPAAE